MKYLKKYSLAICAFMLSLVVAGVCIFCPIYYKNNDTPTNIRTMILDDKDKMSTLSHREEAYEELKKFEEYKISSIDEDLLTFTGTRTFAIEDFEGVDFVCNSTSVEDVQVDYELICDKTTTEITANLSYMQEGEILKNSEIHINSIDYDEETGEAILYFEDGTFLNTADMYQEGEINNCELAILATTAAIVEMVVFVVVVVLVAVIVYYVLNWFFAWLGQTINYHYEQIQVPQEINYQAPVIEINGMRNETRAMTQTDILELDKEKEGDPIYYLAFASGIAYDGVSEETILEDDGLFIGDPISYETACDILSTPTYTTATNNGIKYSYVASIYSYNESAILEVMSSPKVGFSTSTPYCEPEYHNGGLYHYHPNDNYFVGVPFLKDGKEVSKNYRPHAFFLNLDVSYWLDY